MRTAIIALFLAAALVGCRKNATRTAGPPPIPAPAPQAPPKPIEAPQLETPPPAPSQLPPPAVAEEEKPVGPPPQAQRPPSPRRRTRTARSAKPAPPAAEAKPPAPVIGTAPEPKSEAATEETAVPPPVLGEVLNADRRYSLHRELDQNITQSRSALQELDPRRLSRAQAESAVRVKTFCEQAEAYRDSDLPTAVSLSRRAVTLARELVASLR